MSTPRASQSANYVLVAAIVLTVLTSCGDKKERTAKLMQNVEELQGEDCSLTF